LIDLTANFAGKHKSLGETDNATSSWELLARLLFPSKS
jgi:hypothetical protein